MLGKFNLILVFSIIFTMNNFLYSKSRVDIRNVKPLKWVDNKSDRLPMTYDKYKALALSKNSFKAETSFMPSTKRGSKTIALVIENRIKLKIDSEYQGYKTSLVNDGYTIIEHSVEGGDYSDIKSLLKTDYQNNNIEGSIFIGNINMPWARMESWGAISQFPIPLYFMDLDGSWTDSDNDGLFDSHTGNVSPEIWVGILNGYFQSQESEAGLLINYFNKNKMYREGSLTLPKRALSFVDDDWSDTGNADLNQVYSDVTTVDDAYETVSGNYLDKVSQGYEFVHLMSHSCPWSHTFKKGEAAYGGCVSYSEIYAKHPHAFFYNLFNCSGARFIEHDNTGNWYVLNDSYGLGAIGSTKTGSMLDFYNFYKPLGEGKSLGEAFLEWFQVQGDDGFEDWEISWYYGLTFLGDPTLTVNNSVGSYNGNENPFQNSNSSDLTFEQLSTDNNNDVLVSSASFEDKIYTTWVSGRDGRLSIYEKHFDGDSWSNSKAIEQYKYWETDPVIVTDNEGVPHIFFQKFDDASGKYELIHAKFNGSIWYLETLSTTLKGYSVKPSAFVDNDEKIWVAWQNYENAIGNIVCRYLDGTTWSPTYRITDDELLAKNPSITQSPFNDSEMIIFYTRLKDEASKICYKTVNLLGPIGDEVEIVSNDENNTDPKAIYNYDANKLYLTWSYDDETFHRRLKSKTYDTIWSEIGDVFTPTLPDRNITHPNFAVLGNKTLLSISSSDQDYKNIYIYDFTTNALTKVSDDDKDQWYSSIAVSNNKIYNFWQSDASGNNDIYYSIIDNDDIEAKQLPADTKLYQNYPNPFNPTTTINYDLTGINYNSAKIVVYNISGQNIWESSLQTMHASSVQFDGSKFNSGIYYYSIIIDGEKLATKKMVLVK